MKTYEGALPAMLGPALVARTLAADGLVGNQASGLVVVQSQRPPLLVVGATSELLSQPPTELVTQAKVVVAARTRPSTQRQVVREELASLSSLLETAGAMVFDRLLLGTHRWWSLTCANPSCCPSCGRRYRQMS
jgi:hypothetical protein